MTLTFSHDTETGNWTATIDGYYHSTGWCKDLAVARLFRFLKAEYPEILHHRMDAFRDYFAPNEIIDDLPMKVSNETTYTYRQN